MSVVETGTSCRAVIAATLGFRTCSQPAYAATGLGRVALVGVLLGDSLGWTAQALARTRPGQ